MGTGVNAFLFNCNNKNVYTKVSPTLKELTRQRADDA